MSDREPPVRDARVIGALFLLAFLAYGCGSALALPAAEGTAGDLAGAGARVLAGVALMLVNSVVVVELGRRIGRVLRTCAPRVGRGYVVARAVEGLALALGAGALALALADVGSLATLRRVNELTYQAGMLALAVGSVPAWLRLGAAGLVPRWLGAWAVVGYVLLGAGCVAELGGAGVGVLMSVPGGVFEAVFGLGLLVGARWLLGAPRPRGTRAV